MEKLREALDLTRRMREQAREGEWERVQWLESRRQYLLRHCFDRMEELPAPEEVHALLHRIMEVDREVSSLLATARDETARVLQEIGRGRAATHAYRQAGS